MASARQSNSPTELTETRLLVSYGFDLARQLNIDKIMVIAELLTDRKMVDKHREEETIIWVTSDLESLEGGVEKTDQVVEMPHSPVGRMDQVSLALILAVMKGTLTEDESVVCLVGISGSKRLDNLLIVNPKRDFEWFKGRSKQKKSQLPISQEFVRLVDIALKFAAEGREGKPIGTIFLLGDIDELKTIARPLILNPCKGHSKKNRSIHDEDFIETMREFAALDGGFLIDRKGAVEGAGVYLDAPVTKRVKVPKGLGSRHMGAAAATAQTNSLAIVISESSSTVTVFFKGARVLSLGKPDPES
ncbi:MAG: diadenylate cyclase [Verrucomicrobiae bacterium]|nr:diadenylate cyclase [Verrucomicrobiae bacterium]